MNKTLDKGALRTRIAQRRAALSPEECASRDARRSRWLLAELGEPGVMAIYASRAGEPGTLTLIDELAALGWQILLPKIRRSPDWAWSSEGLRPGWAGIPQPVAAGLGAEALGLADVVVVPCLATAPDGTRLGTGGGWYDRALRHRRPESPLWALGNAEEILPWLPREPHDLPVDAVVTEDGFTHFAPGRVS